MKEFDEAIKTYKRIISFSDYEVGIYYTGFGLEWAKSIKNDSLLRIPQLYYKNNDDQNAIRYLRLFEANLKAGVRTEIEEENIKIFQAKLQTTFN